MRHAHTEACAASRGCLAVHALYPSAVVAEGPSYARCPKAYCMHAWPIKIQMALPLLKGACCSFGSGAEHSMRCVLRRAAWCRYLRCPQSRPRRCVSKQAAHASGHGMAHGVHGAPACSRPCTACMHGGRASQDACVEACSLRYAACSMQRAARVPGAALRMAMCLPSMQHVSRACCGGLLLRWWRSQVACVHKHACMWRMLLRLPAKARPGPGPSAARAAFTCALLRHWLSTAPAAAGGPAKPLLTPAHPQTALPPCTCCRWRG